MASSVSFVSVSHDTYKVLVCTDECPTHMSVLRNISPKGIFCEITVTYCSHKFPNRTGFILCDFTKELIPSLTVICITYKFQ